MIKVFKKLIPHLAVGITLLGVYYGTLAYTNSKPQYNGIVERQYTSEDGEPVYVVISVLKGKIEYIVMATCQNKDYPRFSMLELPNGDEVGLLRKSSEETISLSNSYLAVEINREKLRTRKIKQKLNKWAADSFIDDLNGNYSLEALFGVE